MSAPTVLRRPPRERDIRRRRPAGYIQPAAALLSVLVLLGIPLWMVVVTAGKTQAEALNPNLQLPSEWHLMENFGQVFSQANSPRSIQIALRYDF